MQADDDAVAERTKAAAVSTSAAAAQTKQAAQQTASAAHATKSSAERATELAADRTVLAYERTYAAWVRTGLVALASGVGARKLLEGVVPHWAATSAAVILLLFSAFCFVAGIWRQLFRVDAPKPEARKLPSAILIFVNAFLALVAFLALIGVALAWEPG